MLVLLWYFPFLESSCKHTYVYISVSPSHPRTSISISLVLKARVCVGVRQSARLLMRVCVCVTFVHVCVCARTHVRFFLSLYIYMCVFVNFFYCAYPKDKSSKELLNEGRKKDTTVTRQGENFISINMKKSVYRRQLFLKIVILVLPYTCINM